MDFHLKIWFIASLFVSYSGAQNIRLVLDDGTDPDKTDGQAQPGAQIVMRCAPTADYGRFQLLGLQKTLNGDTELVATQNTLNDDDKYHIEFKFDPLPPILIFTIKSVTTEEQGNYQCVILENDQTTVVMTGDEKNIVIYGPLSNVELLQVSDGQYKIFADESTTIQCRAFGSTEPMMTLLLDELVVGEMDVSTGMNGSFIGAITYTFNTDSKGSLICKAKVPTYNAMTSSAVLYIQAKPKVECQDISASEAAKDVTLTCLVTANPPPNRYIWTRSSPTHQYEIEVANEDSSLGVKAAKESTTNPFEEKVTLSFKLLKPGQSIDFGGSTWILTVITPEGDSSYDQGTIKVKKNTIGEVQDNSGVGITPSLLLIVMAWSLY